MMMMPTSQRASDGRDAGRSFCFLLGLRFTTHTQQQQYSVLSFPFPCTCSLYDMIPYALRFAPLLVLPGNVLGIEQKAVLLLLRARTLNCYVTIDECITNIPEVYTYLYMYLPAVAHDQIPCMYLLTTHSLLLRNLFFFSNKALIKTRIYFNRTT